jgi:hypothetical protein
MAGYFAMFRAFAVIGILLMPVSAPAHSFPALDRIAEAGVALVPLNDDELADLTHPSRKALSTAHETGPILRGRSVAEAPDHRAIGDYGLAETTAPTQEKAHPTSPARRRELPDVSGVSRLVDDPRVLGRTAAENSGVVVDHGGMPSPPSTRRRSAIEEEPDPRAVIDWLLYDHRSRIR